MTKTAREQNAEVSDTNLWVLDAEFVQIASRFEPAAFGMSSTRPPVSARGTSSRRPATKSAPGWSPASPPCKTWRRHGAWACCWSSWTCVPDLAAALEVVEAAGDGVGILVATLHFDRSNGDLRLLAAIDRGRLPYLHLSDAPRRATYTLEELLHAERMERLPPDDGEIDLRAIDEMPALIDLSATEDVDAVLSRLRAATTRLLAGECGR